MALDENPQVSPPLWKNPIGRKNIIAGAVGGALLGVGLALRRRAEVTDRRMIELRLESLAERVAHLMTIYDAEEIIEPTTNGTSTGGPDV